MSAHRGSCELPRPWAAHRGCEVGYGAPLVLMAWKLVRAQLPYPFEGKDGLESSAHTC